MRETKMQILIANAKKGASDLAVSVRESLIPVNGKLVCWARLLEENLKKRGILVRRNVGAKSCEAFVYVTNPQGEIVWARGESQHPIPKSPDDPFHDAATRAAFVEEEALLQGVEAALREEQVEGPKRRTHDEE